MLVSCSYLMTRWWSSLIPLTTLAPEDVTTATPNILVFSGEQPSERSEGG
jgi:hypothetical protein